LRNSVKRLAVWCKQNRHRDIGEQCQLLSSKLRGHYNYYGVIGNYQSLAKFFHHVKRLHYYWLNRRSQKRSYTWAGYEALLRVHSLEKPRIGARKAAL
jgi:hypothetical protein